ncbi:hypothetical protein BTJ35_05070 [Lactobacillus delbrueckii subsp. bulgaricus]|nr:hypothetical protein [Lactobacillus delbrueckii subsp. bulgaricus]MBT9090471.1 hypothetical protein [Lactobacillus delbrueckii subsp. bulgaricus]
MFAWEQCKLGDVCEEVSGNNGNVKGLPILTISAANGWMNQKDRFSQVIAGNELKKYTLLKKGHLAYNHGNSKQAKYGTVFVQNLYDQALVPRVYHSFKMKTENNPYYVEYYFATKKLDRELARLVTSGARMDGLLNINKKDFFKIKFEVPTPVEQSLIGTILQKLDQTITLHEEKKRQLERLKSALLQKMFAYKSGYPAIRFEGFSDEWEERKLSDISDVTKLAGFEFTKYVRYQETGKIIALRGLNVKNGKLVLDDVKYIDDSDFSKLNRSKLYKNDILLTYVGTVGELAIVPEDDKYFLAPNVARIRLQDHVNSIFICQMMNNSIFYNHIILPLIATSSQPALSMENVRKFQLLMPDYQEQQKIGSFFKQIDDTIALHQQKINNINSVKKSLLQKMFI